MSYRQHIHFCPKKTIHGVLGQANNWLVLIKRGVEENRHAGEIFELFNQLPEKGILLPIDGLQPSRTVDMDRCRDQGPFLSLDLVSHQHEWRGISFFEVIPHSLC